MGPGSYPVPIYIYYIYIYVDIKLHTHTTSTIARWIFFQPAMFVYRRVHSFFKGPLKRKGEQKHTMIHHQRYWDWHVGSDAGEFIALSSLVLGLRDGCMAW